MTPSPSPARKDRRPRRLPLTISRTQDSLPGRSMPCRFSHLISSSKKQAGVGFPPPHGLPMATLLSLELANVASDGRPGREIIQRVAEFDVLTPPVVSQEGRQPGIAIM